MFYSDGLRFECTGCGACCLGEPGFVYVKESEVQQMATHLKEPLSAFRQRFVRRTQNGLSLRERADGSCVLYDGGCTVYSARPAQCRSYPFWPEVLSSRASWESEKTHCEGIGQGELYSGSQIGKLLQLEGETSRGPKREKFYEKDETP